MAKIIDKFGWSLLTSYFGVQLRWIVYVFLQWLWIPMVVWIWPPYNYDHIGGLEKCLFSPIVGILIQSDFHIFQGVNHQPDIIH